MGLRVRYALDDKLAVAPRKAHLSDFGYDVKAVKEEWLSPYLVKYDTGIYIEGDPRYLCLVFPRSSINRTKLTLANSVGVIDPSYRGNLYFSFRRDVNWFVALLERIFPKWARYNRHKDAYQPGDRIGQIIFVPYVPVDFEYDNTLSRETNERSTGGYGSTGK